MPIYEYECSNGHKFEKLVPMNERDELQPCTHSNCGELGKHVVSAAHLDWRSMGKDSSFPTMYDKWAKLHEQGAKESKD